MNVIRKICHRVAVMDNGRVVEEGEVVEVFKHPEQSITKRFIRQDTDPKNKNTDKVLEQLIEQYPNGKLLQLDRKSTRLNSSHVAISYAVFCLKKKIKKTHNSTVPTYIT